SSTSPVAETYANLLTKKPITTNWYIPASGIAGSYYYKIVSLDDYNNKGTAVTVGPVTVSGITAPPADIIVDNPSATVTGAWTTATSATDQYGSNYLNRSSGSGANKVTFTASIPRTGVWDVAEWHPAGSNRATNARHIITNAGATQTVT